MRRNDPGLRALPSLLPTPRATDGTKGGPNQRGSSGDLMLPSAVMQLLPTPRATRGGSSTETVELLPTPKASNNEKRQSLGYGMNLGQALGVTPLLPTPSVADSIGGHERRGGKRGDELLLKGIAKQLAERDGSESPWGPYAAAIHRWEQVLGRPAPSPTKPGRNGSPKLNPAFVEFMMGAPAGWITDVPGVTDNEALRMAGNGVVRQQVVAALRLMLNRMEVAV